VKFNQVGQWLCQGQGINDDDKIWQQQNDDDDEQVNQHWRKEEVTRVAQTQKTKTLATIQP
tara:strand:- start:423 stop:605 length:183 start_codon:yes stop_codon:yes gene_type:complete